MYYQRLSLLFLPLTTPLPISWNQCCNRRCQVLANLFQFLIYALAGTQWCILKSRIREVPLEEGEYPFFAPSRERTILDKEMSTMTVPIIVAVVVVVFAGALMRATFGFGEAVVSMPLLALLPMSLHTSISLIGLAGLTVAGLTITS